MNVPGRTAAVVSSLMMLGAGVFLVLCQLRFFQLFHIHVPMRDTLRMLPLVEQAIQHGWASIPLETWLEPHAFAHRVALTRVSMVLDYQWFGGRNHLIFLCEALALLALAAVYGRVITDLCAARHADSMFLAGAAAVFLCSPGHYFNSVNPINASWYLVLGASAAAAWLALDARRPVTAPRLALILLLAATAMLSNFAGLMICGLLPLLLWRRGPLWSVCAAIPLMMAVWLYLRGLPPASGMPSGDLAVLGRIVAGMTAYLGAPLAHRWPVPAAVLVGGSVLLMIWIGLATLRRTQGPGARHAAIAFALGMASLCIAIAFVTQLGRFNLRLGEPVPWRYHNVVALYWLNICLLAAAQWGIQARGRIIVTALAGVLVGAQLLQPLPREMDIVAAALEFEDHAAQGTQSRPSPVVLLPGNRRDYLLEFGDFLRTGGFGPFGTGDTNRTRACAAIILAQGRARGTSVAELQLLMLRPVCAARNE